MTTSDARTPASNQSDEAGKSIGWHKGYVQGSRPDLRVPVRQVHLTNGKDVTLYDTSGPYTDPTAETDVRRGLAPLRESWIIARGDTEEYPGRPARPEDDGLKHTSPRMGSPCSSEAESLGKGCATLTRSSQAARACLAEAGTGSR